MSIRYMPIYKILHIYTRIAAISKQTLDVKKHYAHSTRFAAVFDI